MTRTISKSQLAKEMLDKAVSEWQEASKGQEHSDFSITDFDGEIIIFLEFKTAYGPTTIMFNPQAAVEELVEICQRRLERSGLWKYERHREKLLRTQVNGSISALMAAIRIHFEDSIWELPLVASTLYDWMMPPSKSNRQVFDDLLDSINERKRKRFDVKGRGRNPLIIDEVVYLAIENLGDNPSQAAVARFLNVTPQALRQWRKRLGFDKWSDVLKKAKDGRK